MGGIGRPWLWSRVGHRNAACPADRFEISRKELLVKASRTRLSEHIAPPVSHTVQSSIRDTDRAGDTLTGRDRVRPSLLGLDRPDVCRR